MTCVDHDLSATPSIIPFALAGFARQVDVLGTRLTNNVITVWTADPPPSAVDHLLRSIECQWRETKRRALIARAEMEAWQAKLARTRAVKSRARASEMLRSHAAEYGRLCGECDLLDDHAAACRAALPKSETP